MRLAAVLTCMLVLLGVGIRLMFYGLQGVLSSSSPVSALLGFAAGIICFFAGIAVGVLLLKPTYRV